MSKMTKRALLIVTAAVVIVAIGAMLLARFAFTSTRTRSDWKTFHDPLGFYTLQYPPGWGPQGGDAPPIEGYHFNPLPAVANVPYVYIAAYQLNGDVLPFYCAVTHGNRESVKGGLTVDGYYAIPFGNQSMLVSKNAWFEFDIFVPTNGDAQALATDKADIAGILASFHATGGHLTC